MQLASVVLAVVALAGTVSAGFGPYTKCSANEVLQASPPCCEPTCDCDCVQIPCQQLLVYQPTCVCMTGYVRLEGKCVPKTCCPAPKVYETTTAAPVYEKPSCGCGQYPCQCAQPEYKAPAYQPAPSYPCETTPPPCEVTTACPYPVAPYQPPAYQPPAYKPPTYNPPAYQPPAYQPAPSYPCETTPPPCEVTTACPYSVAPYQPPAYQPPAYQPPSYNPPAYQPPAYQPAPSYPCETTPPPCETTTAPCPVYEKPSCGCGQYPCQCAQPEYKAPAYQPAPSYPCETTPPPCEVTTVCPYQTPAYQSPAYKPPAYQPPAYQPPAYQPPAYQPPAYQPPAYQPPAYQPPVYQPPCETTTPPCETTKPPCTEAPPTCTACEQLVFTRPCCEPTCDNDCSTVKCSPLLLVEEPICACRPGLVRYQGHCVEPSACPKSASRYRLYVPKTVSCACNV